VRDLPSAGEALGFASFLEAVWMSPEGFIKFSLEWKVDAPASEQEIVDLQQWRERLFGLGLIGACPDGVGYGNLSSRTGEREFIISGTQTGALPSLAARDYARVIGFDLSSNSVSARGAVKPSSEALTHAACYCGGERIAAVVHVHHLKLWENLMQRGLATAPQASYGSPELARELIQLLRQPAAAVERVVGIAGHREGVFAVGRTLDSAGGVLLELMRNIG
jgi:L-ribulose-5-phosphate 4-epimerase